MNKLQIKRIYLPVDDSDGYRILVDRLWPRGISKEVAALDEWRKEIAPSNELRKSFGHEASKFEVFADSYCKELDENIDAKAFATFCKKMLAQKNVTLLYGAKDSEHNNAVVLAQWIASRHSMI